MGRRYCIEIAEEQSPYYCFSYIDTEDHLADCLFSHLKVNVEFQAEFSCDRDPYRIILCRIPREQRKAFLRSVGLLPGLMAYAGKTDYDEYCAAFMENARRYVNGGTAPLR